MGDVVQLDHINKWIHIMPTPRRSATAYMLEDAMLEQALIHGSYVCECGTSGRATRMVQRLNQARVADRKRNYDRHRSTPLGDPNTRRRQIWERDVMTGEAMRSKWDHFMIKREDTVVKVLKREPLVLRAWTADGTPIPMPDIHPENAIYTESERMNDDGSYWIDEKGNFIDRRWKVEHAGDIGIDPAQPLGLDVTKE